MANPCSNCHQGPYTGPTIPENKSVNWECSAEAHWPEALQEARPELQAYESWVRENFFRAQGATRPLRAPFHLDVASASLQFHLKPKELTFPIRRLPDADVLVEHGGGLSGEWKVSQNALLLGMRNLLEVDGISLDGPFWYDTRPDRVSVGNYGVLHFITKVSTSEYLALTEPGWSGLDYRLLKNKLYDPGYVEFYFPSPLGRKGCFPLGTEDPLPDQAPFDPWECCDGVGRRMEGSVFECFREDHPNPYCQIHPLPGVCTNPKLDFGITSLVPEQFLEENGRLPVEYDLNLLFSRVLSYLGEKEKSKGPPKFLQKLILKASGERPYSLQDLVETADLTFDLQELRDLYLPGILDLGKSQGKLSIQWNAQSGITLLLEDLEINLDPMDYTARNTPEDHPVRLLGGRLTALDPSLPAIRIDYDRDAEEWHVSGQLQIHSEWNLPGLGEVSVSLPLEVRLAVNRWGNLIPGMTTIQLEDIHLVRKAGKAPLDAHFSLQLSDEPGTDGEHYSRVEANTPHFNLNFTGSLGDPGETTLALDGFIPVSEKSIGIDLEESLFNPELSASFRLAQQGKALATTFLDLDVFKPHPFDPKNNDGDFGIRASFDVLRGEDQEDLSDLKAPWLVEGGRIQLMRMALPDGGEEYLFSSGAEVLNLGPLTLNNLEARATIDRISANDGETELRIPAFKITANPRELELSDGSRIPYPRPGDPKGLVQGPLRIELAPCQKEKGGPALACRGKEALSPEEDHALRLLWKPQENRIRFENLNAILELAGIQMPKALETQQRRHRRHVKANGQALKRRADTLALDGHLAGHFDFDYKKLKGKGDLRILGDRKGDIYFQSPSGKTIQPPLLSRSRWRFQRFDKLLLDRGFALGAFRLSTRIHTGSLRKFGISLNYETDIIMNHKDVPIKPGGIKEANYAYYRKLFREIAQRGGLELLLDEGGQP